MQLIESRLLLAARGVQLDNEVTPRGYIMGKLMPLQVVAMTTLLTNMET